MRTTLLVVMAAAALLLAGCASEIVPNLRADMVPANAPREGGAGPEDWAVAVRDPYGKPMPGAAVVAYWPKPCGAQSCRTLEYVLLRTDGGGDAMVHAPTGVNMTFVAQAAGHSEEWILNTRGGHGVVLHLFPPSASATFDFTWNTALGATEGPYPMCQLMDFSLGGEVSPAEWIRHTTEADVTVSWTNGITGVADFETRYLPPPEAFEWRLSGCPGGMEPQPTALFLGPRSSTMHISQAALREEFVGVEGIPEHFYVGPVARGPAVGVVMPYQVTINATLEHYEFGDQIPEYRGYAWEQVRADAEAGTVGPDGTTTYPQDAPAAGLWLVLGALAVAALVRRS